MTILRTGRCCLFYLRHIMTKSCCHLILGSRLCASGYICITLATPITGPIRIQAWLRTGCLIPFRLCHIMSKYRKFFRLCIPCSIFTIYTVFIDTAPAFFSCFCTGCFCRNTPFTHLVAGHWNRLTTSFFFLLTSGTNLCLHTIFGICRCLQHYSFPVMPQWFTYDHIHGCRCKSSLHQIKCTLT